jgi:ATP-dependent helicase HrpB
MLAVETVDRDLFEGLVLNESPRDVDKAQAADILAAEILRGGLKLERWDEAVEQWIARTRCVAQWFPERNLISYDDDDRRLILSEICAGATRYKEVKDKPVLDDVKNALSWDDQRFVEQMAPERLQLPRGWRMKIDYTPGQPPRGRAKIQDLYDLTQTPTVAGGRAKLILEILGPNFRPVQLTDDLANFWTNLYPMLKKELSRKYPRHEWR